MSSRLVAALAVTSLLGAASVATSAVAHEPPVKDAAAPGLADAIAEAGTGDLTVFVRGVTTGDAVEAVEAAGLRLVDRWERIDVAVGHGPAARVPALLEMEGIQYVEPNRDLTLHLDTAHLATRAEDARDPAFGVTRPDGTPYDGSGVTIAVVDSGLDATHPMFQRPDGTSKVVRNYFQACRVAICSGFVELDDTDTPAASGHGTHVAGIAAGFEDTTSVGEVVRGAAPGADLIGYGHGLGLNLFNVNSAFDHILDTHANPCGDGSCPPIKVVNNSWGGDPDHHDPDSATSLLVNELVDEGITVVFANGNDGGDGSTLQSNPEAQNPTPGVIGVANYDDGDSGNRDGDLASGSSRGLKGEVETYPDISAPGTNIRSACRPWLPLCYVGLGFDAGLEYFDETGTSMAAPYIAGVVALMLEADPSLTPAEIEDLLEDNAHKFGDPASYESDPSNGDDTTSFDKGHGLVDVVATLADVLDVTDPPVDACLPGASSTTYDDNVGDATEYVVETGAAAANDPALDIERVTVTWDGATDSATFEVKVDDLRDAPPSASVGEYFDLNFSVGGGGYYITANWNRIEGESFLLGRFETTRSTIASGLVGSFDVATDTITAVLPAEVFDANGAKVFEIPDGGAITGLDVVSRRDTLVFVPNADSAAGGCPVTAAR